MNSHRSTSGGGEGSNKSPLCKNQIAALKKRNEQLKASIASLKSVGSCGSTNEASNDDNNKAINCQQTNKKSKCLESLDIVYNISVK